MRINIVIFFIVCSLFPQCHAQTKTDHKNRLADTVYTWQKASADGTGKFYMGREIARVMGAEGSDWLERNERQQEENTTLAIKKINLSSNSIVADIGAGTGYFSFRLSSRVPAGKVYAVEIQDELIKYLRNKKSALKDTVLQIVKGSDVSPNLPENSIDLAIMVDVYHELEFPHEMLQSVKKSLKPHGKILLIEYRGEDPAIAIKALHKTTVGQLNRELNANGFQLYSAEEFLPIQHFLLYQKK
ncbi:MAG: class I SAM-dependent methyltransferase [Bacteroidota bacterium]